MLKTLARVPVTPRRERLSEPRNVALRPLGTIVLMCVCIHE